MQNNAEGGVGGVGTHSECIPLIAVVASVDLGEKNVVLEAGVIRVEVMVL